MTTFSVTERQTFKRCRRQWGFSSANKGNLTKVGFGSDALELGSIVHRALAAWGLDSSKDLALHFLEHGNARIEEVEANYRSTVGTGMSDEEKEPFYSQMRLGVAMMKNYQKKWGTPVPEGLYPFVSFEQAIEVPVPGTEHYLSATLDGLLQNDKGHIYVLERKTYDKRPDFLSLDMNDQFIAYCWVAQQLKIGPVRGVAYDGLWKRDKVPSGRTFDDLFLRKLLPKTIEEIEEWGRWLPYEIADMASNPVLYPNVRWEGCYDCSFIDPCRQQLKGVDIESMLASKYTQRKIVRVQGVALPIV